MKATDALPCWIYRTRKKEGLYLYLAKEDGFDAVPSEVLNHFGLPEFALDLELSATRQLAREDVSEVMKNLVEQGFHLQVPPPDYESEI